MAFDAEPEDDYTRRRIERLEMSYRRAQGVLAGAQAQYYTLRKTLGTSEAQLTDSINRLHRAREQVEDILSTIEFLEDPVYRAAAAHRMS
jgi:hypothetical protein